MGIPKPNLLFTGTDSTTLTKTPAGQTLGLVAMVIYHLFYNSDKNEGLEENSDALSSLYSPNSGGNI